MKRSELEKIITDLGLEFEIENSSNLIMQIWQPYADSGFKIGSKYYTASCLGKKEVDDLNNKFKKLLVVLDANDIQINRTHNIENGVISTWIIDLRKDNLPNSDRNLDFEIETKIKTNSNIVNYYDAMPLKVGYGYSGKIDVMFGSDKFKKHEMDLIIQNIDEVLEASKKDASWIVEFSVSQNNVTPVQVAIEKNVITSDSAIYALFDHDEIYYDKQREYGTILKYLTTFKIDELNIVDKNYRGKLPDLVIETSSLYSNVLKNWEFEKKTGQKILTMMVQDEQLKQFKQFINLKDTKKYKFQDWYDLKEQVLKLLCSDDEKFLQKLLSDGWFDFSNVESLAIIDFLIETFNQFGTPSYLIIIKEFMRLFPGEHKTLLTHLFDKFDKEDFHDSFLSRDIMDVFIKNMKIDSAADFMINDAIIMFYLPDNHPLKNKLLSNGDFLNYIAKVDKLEYMPETVKDVFLF